MNYLLQVKAALEALDGIDQVTVSAPQALPQDYLGKMCPGRRFEITFEDNRGNLPLLEIGSQGLFGSDLRTGVEEVCPSDSKLLKILLTRVHRKLLEAYFFVLFQDTCFKLLKSHHR